MAKARADAEVFFFDEARFGTKPSFGKMWAKVGETPVAVVKPGYQSFFAYSAVCPATGEDATLFLPKVNTDTMSYFLAHMADVLKGRECLLVMDRAGWHCSKELKVPPNIEIVHLPPYSPELNPVERLWQWLKRHAIRNRLHLSIEEVMDAAQDCMRTVTAPFLKSVCRCNYLSH
jgi:transposase